VPFTEQELGQMNALVKDAIGFSKDRGDSLNLVNTPFSTEPELAPVETSLWQHPETISIAKESGKALFLLAALGFVALGVLRPAIRQISASMERAERDVTPGPAALGAANPLAALPAGAGSQLSEVQRIARDDPATVANVVRSWVQK
jgi:flagellar M-ring protein FliF